MKLSLSFFIWHDRIESQHAEHTQEELEELYFAHEIDEDGYGEQIYTKELLSQWPLRAPRSTSEVTYSTFKQQYMGRLSEEIGRLFYEYYNGDDIPEAI